MRKSVASIWLLAHLISMGAGGCSGAEGLVGLWRTEIVHATRPGGTNLVEYSETVEFLKDGSFKMGSSIATDGERQTAVVFTGTYALIDRNRVRLEIVASQARPSNKTPLTVTFSIVGDELEMSKLIPSVVPETQKYRRVKR
jgi:hypothetical protein